MDPLYFAIRTRSGLVFLIALKGISYLSFVT